MSRATVFVSSTFKDLSATRKRVGETLMGMGYQPILFENGSLSYDPRVSLETSGFEQIKKSHILVLLVGKRYGSPVQDPNGERPKHDYVSITRREYEIARDLGIPIFTFAVKDLQEDSDVYSAKKKQKKRVSAGGHDMQVLELLDLIKREQRNNPIFWWEEAGEIIEHIKSQLSGLVRRHIEDMLSREHKVPINCFKLFWHRLDRDGKRNGRALTIEQLAEETGLPIRFLRRVETRKNVPGNPISDETFHRCKLSDLEQLETALNCRGELRAGQEDDFRTPYLIHYRRRGRNGARAKDPRQQELNLTTRAVVFDFDGTLSTERNSGTVWEMLWEEVGLTKQECAHHHSRFRQGEIDHKQWCELTRDRFREKGLTREQLEKFSRSIKLVPKAAEVIQELSRRQISLSILSGSIKPVIKQVLGKSVELFEHVNANGMEFDGDGLISNIISTPYDFQTKPKFIRDQLIVPRQMDPLDILFVGNSVNDTWVSRSGARTLCVNPIRTDPDNFRNWSHSIEYMTSLDQILQFIGSPNAENVH